MAHSVDTSPAEPLSGTAEGREPRIGLVSGILALAALVLWLGGMALTLETVRLDDQASGKVAVLFWPTQDAETNFRAIAAAGGAPVRPVIGSAVWIAHSDTPGFVGRLRAQGARAAYGEIRFGPIFAGCFSYVVGDRNKRPDFIVQ